MKNIHPPGIIINVIINFRIDNNKYYSHLKASKVLRSRTRCEQRAEPFQLMTMKRHLPQLLVRGDIVVTICRVL